MEQLHRVQRYLDRIREIYEGCPQRYERVEFYEDDVISFFIHCHHLLDWLPTLNKAAVTKVELNEFINNHKELRICADLCNGEKHCRLERLRSGKQPHLASKDWHITTYTPESGKPVTFRAKYRILSNYGVHDALELAETCMNLWRDQVRKIALMTI